MEEPLQRKEEFKWRAKEFDNTQHYDMWSTYKDLWLSKTQRNDLIQQGIDDDGTTNKIRVKTKEKEANKDTYKIVTGDAKQNAIAKTYGSTFSIPIDHEILSYISLLP